MPVAIALLPSVLDKTGGSAITTLASMFASLAFTLAVTLPKIPSSGFAMTWPF